jgi:hypothetical protein
MKTVPIVIDTPLRQEADRAHTIKRSKLVREALSASLTRIRPLEMEHRDRRGYEAKPDTLDHWDVWEREAAWPDE